MIQPCSRRSFIVEYLEPSPPFDAEDIKGYKHKGLHPVAIGDTLSDRRYKIVHKLGYGKSSTVWLARNQADKLVTLRIMSAAASLKPDKVPDLVVPQKVLDYIRAQDPVPPSNVQVIEDHFIEEGANGSHLCLVSDFAGPNILSILETPGKAVIGRIRLRGDLARKISWQVAKALRLIHSAGFVHGDLTTANILLQFDDSVKDLPDGLVYSTFGQPVLDATEDGYVNDSRPPHLIAPIKRTVLTHSPFLTQDALLIHFGQSFRSSHPPRKYKPATAVHYMPPEAWFDNKIDTPADIWALACAIYEIRAGYPLFDTCFEEPENVLPEMVEILGKFPEPWWGAFENRHKWFDEDGSPKPGSPVTMGSIEEQVANIGSRDVRLATGSGGPPLEIAGTRLDEFESQLLRDLLEKMLRYQPQERINIDEVVSHPYFTY